MASPWRSSWPTLPNCTAPTSNCTVPAISTGFGHASAGCCIDNTDFFELFGASGPRDLRTEGEEWGLLNAPLIEDGCIAPPGGPGWGAVWDEDRVGSLTVATD